MVFRASWNRKGNFFFEIRFFKKKLSLPTEPDEFSEEKNFSRDDFAKSFLPFRWNFREKWKEIDRDRISYSKFFTTERKLSRRIVWSIQSSCWSSGSKSVCSNRKFSFLRSVSESWIAERKTKEISFPCFFGPTLQTFEPMKLNIFDFIDSGWRYRVYCQKRFCARRCSDGHRNPKISFVENRSFCVRFFKMKKEK